MPANREHLPAYKNALIVGGLMLGLLGAGNWIVGAIRAEPYAAFLSQSPKADTLPESLKTRLLEPDDESLEERSISQAKLEFYELVRTGGRLMVVVGSLFLISGMLSLGWSRGTAPPFVNIRRARAPSPGRESPLP